MRFLFEIINFIKNMNDKKIISSIRDAFLSLFLSHWKFSILLKVI